jgi:hypothetical protein
VTELMHEVTAEIAAAPHAAASLTLYALVSTLEFEKAGCLFKLIKLRDLSPSQRRLAYRLMELMAEGVNGCDRWQFAKREMDALIRSA